MKTKLCAVGGALLAVVGQVAANSGWIRPDAPYQLALTATLDNPRFILNQADLTALFVPVAGGYQYQAHIRPLPAGEHTLAVYEVDEENQWQLVQEEPLQVLTAGQQVKAER